MGRILYLGDTTLDQQGSYLAGVMSYYNMSFEYVNSEVRFSDSLLKRDYKLMILSDYPSSNFTAQQIKAIADKVSEGMSLLMIGGWDSFTGIDGGYGNTPLATVLPVIMQENDDRINFSGPCLIAKEQNHEIIDSLPFDEDTSTIGGLNSFDVKKDSTVLLSAYEYNVSRHNGKFEFAKGKTYPLLVIGNYGLGKTAAFASDVAPHWVGPFVDWGDKRIKARAEGSDSIEVGNLYAQFFANLLGWMI